MVSTKTSTLYFQIEKIKVSVLQKLNPSELKKEFGLRNGEVDVLKYQLEHKELYVTEVNNNYYLFIPFYYIFEDIYNNEEPVYIVLESQEMSFFSCEAESIIIQNILTKFSDDLLNLLIEDLVK